VTEPLPDVWTNRDYPVLREIVQVIDTGDLARLEELAEATGLELQQVSRAITALERRGYVTADRSLAGVMGASEVSGEAYLVTGLHPSGDDAVSQLVSGLRQAADEIADPDEKSKLRKLADEVGGVSRDVLSGVLTAVITAAGRGVIGG
jgi:DNA-binding transcriptional ArsR family regulator